jgi:hypothetical protein
LGELEELVHVEIPRKRLEIYERNGWGKGSGDSYGGENKERVFIVRIR